MKPADTLAGVIASRPLGEPVFPFLRPEFLQAMNDIGRYGNEKYAEHSFHQRALRGDRSRGEMKRTESAEIGEHAAEHFRMYLCGELHDHFNTRIHQLAAVAFNAMMEAFFDGEHATPGVDLRKAGEL